MLLACLQFVWGDVKPDHFIWLDARGHNLRIFDFDSALRMGDTVLMVCTPTFAPPEQAERINDIRNGPLSFLLRFLTARLLCQVESQSSCSHRQLTTVIFARTCKSICLQCGRLEFASC